MIDAKYLLLIVFAGCFAIACSTSAVENKRAANVPASDPSPGMPGVTFDTPRPIEAARISLADAKKAYDEGDAFVVDVRGPDSFNQEHIQGAVNIGIGDLETNLAKLPKDKKIIVYCSCGAEHSSLAWVAKAKQKGIDNAYALIGGTAAWVEAGYPVDRQR